MDDNAMEQVRDLQRWALPSHGLKIDAVDTHCGGEPLRLIVGGFPVPLGRTMAERLAYAREHLDHLRQALVMEPRGHGRSYGALVTPAERLDSHCGVLFFDANDFRPVSGHGLMALGTALIETGLAPMSGPETRLKIDTVAGMIRIFARIDDGRVSSVYCENVPAHVIALDHAVELPGIGTVKVDLAFGGLIYAFVKAADLGCHCTAEHFPALRAAATAIRAQLAPIVQPSHAPRPELATLSGIVFIDSPPRRRGAATVADTRHLCIFSGGAVNRSPGGAAISARLAIEITRGHLESGDLFRVESPSGAIFDSKVVGTVPCSFGDAVATEVQGTAFVTGLTTLLIDPGDPCHGGFSLER